MYFAFHWAQCLCIIFIGKHSFGYLNNFRVVTTNLTTTPTLPKTYLCLRLFCQYCLCVCCYPCNKSNNNTNSIHIQGSYKRITAEWAQMLQDTPSKRVCNGKNLHKYIHTYILLGIFISKTSSPPCWGVVYSHICTAGECRQLRSRK